MFTPEPRLCFLVVDIAPDSLQHAAFELRTESGTGLLALVLKCAVGCLPAKLTGSLLLCRMRCSLLGSADEVTPSEIFQESGSRCEPCSTPYFEHMRFRSHFSR